MIFHSLDFIVFFVAFVGDLLAAAAARPERAAAWSASYFFYGYVHPWFLILIATSTVIDYCAARGMEALAAAAPARSCG